MPLASRKTAFKRSTKTPGVARKSIKSTKQASRLPPPDDYEDSQATEDENWVEDLRDYLRQHLQSYLQATDLSEEHQNILNRVVHSYRRELSQNYTITSTPYYFFSILGSFIGGNVVPFRSIALGIVEPLVRVSSAPFDRDIPLVSGMPDAFGFGVPLANCNSSAFDIVVLFGSCTSKALGISLPPPIAFTIAVVDDGSFFCPFPVLNEFWRADSFFPPIDIEVELMIVMNQYSNTQ